MARCGCGWTVVKGIPVRVSLCPKHKRREDKIKARSRETLRVLRVEP